MTQLGTDVACRAELISGDGQMMSLNQDDERLCFRLQPNCALSWKWTKRLVLGFACLMAMLGAYFVSIGAWIVLPFFGLELFVVALGFYLSAVEGSTHELIRIDDNQVVVLRGRHKLQEIIRLPAPWTRVLLIEQSSGWYPSRLVLRCHQRSVKIAVRLVDAERSALADALGDRLGFGFQPNAVSHLPVLPPEMRDARLNVACRSGDDPAQEGRASRPVRSVSEPCCRSGLDEMS